MKIRMIGWAAVAAVLVACNRMVETPEAEEVSTAVRTAKVDYGPIEAVLQLNAKVACDEKRLRQLYVPCTGKVSGVTVEVGDRVTAGQCLALVSSEEAAACQKERTDVASALRVAQRQLQSAESLYANGMLSEREWKEANEEVMRLEAEVQRLQTVAAIKGYQGDAQAVLRSPISGYVMAKNISNDRHVDDAANDVPAFEIADIREVWVIADVYENDIAKVAEGAAVKVTTLAWPDLVFEGKIEKKFNRIDPESKTMKVRIGLPNPEGRLLPGSFACVQVDVAPNHTSALKIPAASLVFEQGRHAVVVQRSEGYACVPVTVLRREADTAWVEGDLQVGEEIVTQNALLIYNALKTPAA